MSKFRRFFTSALMVMVVLGMSAFASVDNASASAQAGDLIKMDGLSAVYYLGEDGKRYVFPNQSTYFSWYEDFSGVVTISATELQSYPLGDNVTMRPGTSLVKITTDPKVYAVEPGGNLRWIQSEADAATLFGVNWADLVVDVPDSFFTNYTIVSALETGEYPAGSLLKNVDGSAIYYWTGDEYRQFSSEAAFVANGFSFNDVMETVGHAWTPLGDPITAHERAFNIDYYVDPVDDDDPATGTGLSVALSADTPASQSIPESVSRIPFTKFNVTAAHDGDVKLESVTVRRTGLTGNADGVGVWLEKDGQILTSKRSLTSDQAILTVSPSLTVPAGETVTVTVMAELTSVTGNMALGVNSASAITAGGATVSGSFPITGNLMSFTNYDVAKIKLTDTSPVNAYEVKVGDVDVELGSFEFEITENRRDVMFESVTFRNTGPEDMETALLDVYLESAGERVSEYATFNGRYITFELLDGGMLIEEDDSLHDFVMRGDIIGKENVASEAFDFSIRRNEHIVAYEKATGFGVSIEGSIGQYSKVEIEAGAISVSRKASSPSDKTVVKGDRDVVALIANIRTDEAVSVEGIDIKHEGNDDYEDSFQNARVYVNNTLLDTFDPSDSPETIDTYFDLSAGDNELKITVDVKRSATSSKWIKFSVDQDLFDDYVPEYISTGNPVTLTDITGSASGAEIKVEEAEMTFTRNDGYSVDRPIVQGAEDVSLGKFALRARYDEIRINRISLGENTDDNGLSSDDISDMKLYANGVKIGDTRNFTSNGADFSSLNYNVGINETINLELKGTFSSSAATGTKFITELTVNAQDSTGRSIDNATSTTQRFEIVEAGDINFEVLSDPVSSLLATKEGVDQTVASFDITSINDSANLTEISIANWDGAEATSTADARIKNVKLYHGTTVVDQTSMVNGNATFFLDNDVIVGANATENLHVTVELNDIDNDANATNKELQIRFVDLEFRTSAGQTKTQTLEADANKFVIRNTVPTIAHQSLDSTLLSAGDVAIAKFTVSADENNSLEVGQFVIDITKTTNVTWATTSNTLRVNNSFRSGVTAATTTEGDLVVNFSNPEIISAGDTKTFEVYIDVTDAGDGDSIVGRLQENAEFESGEEITELTDPTFTWSDRAEIGVKTWANSALIKGLPTTSWTLSN